MKIEYFLLNGYLDDRALNGGIYQVDLGKVDSDKWIHLYVGEAGCMIKRCGQHLLEFSNDCKYFGLEKSDCKLEDLILKFSVNRKIEKAKKPYYDEEYIKNENEVKKELQPITQMINENVDDMISEDEKIKKVHQKMDEYGFI